MADRLPEQTTGELPPESPPWTYDIANGKALNAGLPKLPGLNVEIFFGEKNNRPRWLIVPAPWTVLPKETTPGGTGLEEKRADPKNPKSNGEEIFCWEFDPPPEQIGDRALYRHAYDALREALRNPKFREEARDYIQQRFSNLMQNREDVLPRLPMPPDGRPSLKRQEAIPDAASPQYSWFDRPMLVSKPGSAISAGNPFPGFAPPVPTFEATSPSYEYDDDDPAEAANPAPMPGPSDGDTETHAEVADEGGLYTTQPSALLSNQENIPKSKLPGPIPTTQTGQQVPKEAAAAAAAAAPPPPPPRKLPDPLPTNQAGQQASKQAPPPPPPPPQGPNPIPTNQAKQQVSNPPPAPEQEGEEEELEEETSSNSSADTSVIDKETSPWHNPEYTDQLVQEAADKLLKNAEAYWPPERIHRRMRMWSGVEIRDRTTIGLEGQIDQLPPFPGKFNPAADAVGTLKRKRGRAPKAAAAAAAAAAAGAAADGSKQAAPGDGDGDGNGDGGEDGDGDGDQAPQAAAKGAPKRDAFYINTRTHGSFPQTARRGRRSKRISRMNKKKKKKKKK